MMSDLNRIFNFMLACDVAEFGAPDSDLGDLTDQWNEADLSKDAWISTNENGEVDGYALFSVTTNSRCDLDTYIHPNNSPFAQRGYFFDQAISRFQEAASEGSNLVTYINAHNKIACEEAERHGFVVKKYHARMQMDFSEPYPEPQWPAGYQLLPYTEDAEMELFNLIINAFDWEGVQPFDHATWKKQVFRGGRINPEDFMLLRCEGKLAAAALCYNEDNMVWLKELAVSKEFQGKGLGSLMLKHVFSKYSRMGIPTVALGVVSTNPKATEFYKHSGMTETRLFAQYERAF